MERFSQGLLQLAEQRQQVVTALKQLAQSLSSGDSSAEETPTDSAEFQTVRQELGQVADRLRQSKFKIVILGDMKRGKSTLLNALLGEPLLPSDVNPCTAVLTVIRHGSSPQVTLQYQDDRPTESIDFETFKQNYTIPPDTARQLEASHKEAFPDLSHAVINYPLPWLEAGVELVDTPGLNDTEARNQQVLTYLNQAQAVVFVLSATQPMTLDEQRYLTNYLSDRDRPVFFLINGFDRIDRKSVV